MNFFWMILDDGQQNFSNKIYFKHFHLELLFSEKFSLKKKSAEHNDVVLFSVADTDQLRFHIRN